jgi:hypothetical protein
MEWIACIAIIIGLAGLIDAIIQTSKSNKYNRDENED